MTGMERWNIAQYRDYLAGRETAGDARAATRPHRQTTTEFDEQVRFFAFVEILGGRHPGLADALLDVYATANGGKRHRGEAGKLRASGVRRGVPDIEVWIPRDPFHGMVIELKAAHSGRATPEQKSRIERLRARGYRAEVIHGWMAAARCLCDYLSTPFPDDAASAVDLHLMATRGARQKRRRERSKTPLPESGCTVLSHRPPRTGASPHVRRNRSVCRDAGGTT